VSGIANSLSPKLQIFQLLWVLLRQTERFEASQWLLTWFSSSKPTCKLSYLLDYDWVEASRLEISESDPSSSLCHPSSAQAGRTLRQSDTSFKHRTKKYAKDHPKKLSGCYQLWNIAVVFYHCMTCKNEKTHHLRQPLYVVVTSNTSQRLPLERKHSLSLLRLSVNYWLLLTKAYMFQSFIFSRLLGSA